MAVSSPSKAIVSQAKRARKARYHEMMMQRAMDRWEAVSAVQLKSKGKRPLLADPSIGGGLLVEEPSCWSDEPLP